MNLSNNNFTKEEYIIVLSIMVVPFLFFAYNFFPGIQFLPIPLTKWRINFYNDLDGDMWFFAGRILIFCLYSLWYITCSYKWRFWLFALFYLQIISLVAYLNQLLGINGMFTLNLSGTLIIALIVLILFVPLLIYFRSIFRISNIGDTSFYTRFNNELIEGLKIKSRFSTKKLRRFKQEFKDLKNKKGELGDKDYLKELIRLRESYSLE